MTVTLATQDPRTQYPQPPYPVDPQSAPGLEGQMSSKPDHGEETYQGSGRLAGRAALITGADSGIGKAVALAFAREGADVLISYLSEEEDALDTERLVTEAGRKAVRVSGDIQSPDHCRQLVEIAVREFGHLDILVNNAAYQATHQDIVEFTPEELEKTFRTNVFAMFYLSQEAVKHMQPGAAIINTTSIQAYQPSPSLLAYAATKGAIANFTKAFAEQCAEKGIRVNAVAPGPIWTPLIPSTMPEEQVKSFGGDTPLKRAGQPAELAPVYVLLASQEASYVTAQIYGVTGGESLT